MTGSVEQLRVELGDRANDILIGPELIATAGERILPLMRRGGFIPSVDHQTPPGVSMAEYRIFLKLFNEYTVLGAKS
jgi:hypothetical protein